MTQASTTPKNLPDGYIDNLTTDDKILDVNESLELQNRDDYQVFDKMDNLSNMDQYLKQGLNLSSSEIAKKTIDSIEDKELISLGILFSVLVGTLNQKLENNTATTVTDANTLKNSLGNNNSQAYQALAKIQDIINQNSADNTVGGKSDELLNYIIKDYNAKITPQNANNRTPASSTTQQASDGSNSLWTYAPSVVAGAINPVYGVGMAAGTGLVSGFNWEEINKEKGAGMLMKGVLQAGTQIKKDVFGASNGKSIVENTKDYFSEMYNNIDHAFGDNLSKKPKTRKLAVITSMLAMAGTLFYGGKKLLDSKMAKKGMTKLENNPIKTFLGLATSAIGISLFTGDDDEKTEKNNTSNTPAPAQSPPATTTLSPKSLEITDSKEKKEINELIKASQSKKFTKQQYEQLKEYFKKNKNSTLKIDNTTIQYNAKYNRIIFRNKNSDMIYIHTDTGKVHKEINNNNSITFQETFYIPPPTSPTP